MEQEAFHYTYCAKEQEEIKSIRDKYCAPPEEDKMTRLRRLDAAVTRKATNLSLTVGIIGALILGTGMSLIMTNLGARIGLSQMMSVFLGIVIGVMGITPVCCAYPLYHRTLNKERNRIAPEILRLTDELLK